MAVGRESKFSEWTLAVRGGNNDIWDAMRYLGKAALRVNEMQIRMINWVAQRLNFVRKGGLLDSDEFADAAAMLDGRSVTASGCARELLAEAHRKQPGEAKAALLGVLANGSGAAKMAAAESLSRIGDAGEAAKICGLMPEFGKGGRAELASMAERLVMDGEGGADIREIAGVLKEGAARLRANGEDAQEEFRKYCSRLGNAARMADAELKKPKRRKRAKPCQVMRKAY